MFYEDFDDIENLKKSYHITDEDLEGVDILYSEYECYPYEGYSIVLFKKDEKLFIVEASHCSCDALEGKWDPIETCEEALRIEIKAKSNSYFIQFESFIEFCYAYFKWERKWSLNLTLASQFLPLRALRKLSF